MFFSKNKPWVQFCLHFGYMYHTNEVTNYTEPGKTTQKRGTNKNNLVPSEVQNF